MISRLGAKGFSAEDISLSALMIEALEALGCLSEFYFGEESKNRDVIAQSLGRELPREIARRLRHLIGERDVSHCTALLRAGALFPFVHVSSLLSSMERESIRCTVVVPYPGRNEGEMLNFKDQDTRRYYRAEIICKER